MSHRLEMRDNTACLGQNFESEACIYELGPGHGGLSVVRIRKPLSFDSWEHLKSFKLWSDMLDFHLR